MFEKKSFSSYLSVRRVYVNNGVQGTNGSKRADLVMGVLMQLFLGFYIITKLKQHVDSAFLSSRGTNHLLIILIFYCEKF